MYDMNKLFYELSDENKKEFSDCFYKKIGARLPEGMTVEEVIETGHHFPEPWYWGDEVLPLTGETIEEKVDSYIDQYLEEIIYSIKEYRVHHELYMLWQEEVEEAALAWRKKVDENMGKEN